MNCLICGAWVPEQLGPYNKEDAPFCAECFKAMSTDPPPSLWPAFVTGFLLGAAVAFAIVWWLSRGGLM